MTRLTSQLPLNLFRAPKGKSKSSKTAASSRKTSVGASGLTTPAGGPDGSVVGTPAPGSNYVREWEQPF